MLRVKRTTSASRKRVEVTPARVAAEGEEAKRYVGAFARLRLVRAWIGAVAAIVAMLSAYMTLLERIERWWASFPVWRA